MENLIENSYMTVRLKSIYRKVQITGYLGYNPWLVVASHDSVGGVMLGLLTGGGSVNKNKINIRTIYNLNNSVEIIDSTFETPLFLKSSNLGIMQFNFIPLTKIKTELNVEII